jgi:hypothetical protein
MKYLKRLAKSAVVFRVTKLRRLGLLHADFGTLKCRFLCWALDKNPNPPEEMLPE